MQKTSSKYTIGGFILGILVRILLIFVTLVAGKYSLSIGSIIQFHIDMPVNYVLDFAPILILTAVGYYVDKNFAIKLIEIEDIRNREIKKEKRIFRFVEQLREGEMHTDFDLKDKSDELVNSLVKLSHELQATQKIDAERKKEDAQRSWVTEGVAMFGEILRNYNDNIEELSYQVISNLVKYMNINQAGFYVVKENKNNDKYFELSAQYAYGRKKFCDQKLEWGEGLVGACALEQKTIFLTEVSENYITISSGLGEAKPRSVLIIPLMTEEIHGVIEMASFKVFEPFEIEFVERIAESTASTLSNLKINLQTAELLKDSQKQAEKMGLQEDLLRKNMKTLRDTQVKAAKQSEEFMSFTNSVNHTMIRAEYNTQGKLLYANTKFLDKLEYTSNSEVEGEDISKFINEKDKEWFSPIWSRLVAGGKHFEGAMKHITKSGKEVWVIATYVSVRNYHGSTEKILFLGIDTTEQKKQSLDYKGQIDALNRSSIKLEFSLNGRILDFNERYLKFIGFQEMELTEKSIFSIISLHEVEKFKKTWTKIVSGTPFEGRIKQISKEGTAKWLYGTFTAVHDMYDEIAKIIFIGHNITAQVHIEEENRRQTNQLKIQEEKLRKSEIELSNKLQKTRNEVVSQFKEIEIVKLLNEKTLAGALDAIVSIDQFGSIEFFNDAAVELWEKPRQEILGRPVEILLPEKYASEENYMGNYFKVSNNILLGTRTEVFIINQRGEKVPVLITLSEARVDEAYRLTAFVQNIEVELF